MLATSSPKREGIVYILLQLAQPQRLQELQLL